jgi:regulatory protein
MSPLQDFLYDKARNYCDYAERCIYDVRNKLKLWQATDSSIEKIITRLEKEDFINEERYAVSFAIGKLRNNKWGRTKIFHALAQKHIPEIYIQMGLNEIDEEEYINTLKAVLKSKNISGNDDFKKKTKLVKYAQQKGFNPNLVWNILNNSNF